MGNKAVILVLALGIGYWLYMNVGATDVNVEMNPYDEAAGLFQALQYESAIAAYRRGLETDPDSPRAKDAKFKIARSLEQLKRDSEALAAYRAYLKEYPDGGEFSKKAKDRIERYQLQGVK